ncbi:hypothetical protein PS900_00962 [Pseudomonas fluorescens]|uniref:Integrase n=2 Tax=Pseudomonas fluorescens TaxID=294 RepID=A0A5E7HJM1_PSEFL|nr:hypothetical protein PS900_00962 [Pseudomonas fluorescens]VVO76878.1 hypothetical protein PS854_01593 [Pseudomonas fluorescens]
MASPFVPFPMFCPYAQWRPWGLEQFPENNELTARLEAVDASCLPFVSLWYCQRYLAWLAHSWTPEQANESYYFETIHLERLLNWCFSKGLSLLDLQAQDLCRYVEFFRSPSADWCAPAVCLKFLPNPLEPYGNWMMNPSWRPFLSSPRDVSCQLGLAQVVINRFYDFYFQDVSIPQAGSVLGGLWAQPKRHFSKLSEYELDWYMKSLAALPYGEDYKQLTLMYFAVARFSLQSRRQVIGSQSSPGLLSQFSKGANGVWLEMLPQGEMRALDPKFSDIFELYLKHLDVDAGRPLQPSKLFSTSPEGKFARKCRLQLVEMAADSSDPVIRNAVEKFRTLTFSSIRKSFR